MFMAFLRRRRLRRIRVFMRFLYHAACTRMEFLPWMAL